MAMPTDARERAKAKIKKLKAAGEDPKLLKEIRKKLQEQHFDDCGSDTNPIEAEETATFNETLAYCFGCSGSELTGFHFDADDFIADFPAAQPHIVTPEELCAFMTKSRQESAKSGIVELFGGAAGVTQLTN